MLRMTRVGGSGTGHGRLARPRARTIVHAPRQHQSEILRCAQDDKSRRQPHGTRANLRGHVQGPSFTHRARAKARSFAALRMTRVGGSRTEQDKLARPRARTIVHAPRQRQSEILRHAQNDKSRRQPHGTGQACEAARKDHRSRAAQRHSEILRDAQSDNAPAPRAPAQHGPAQSDSCACGCRASHAASCCR